MPESLPHRPWVPFALLGAMWVLLALLTIPTWGWTYWDFGDGNYMYIARRVREGLVLYKDILAPQPPLHTFAGVLAQEFGARFLGGELEGVRAYCLAVRCAASLAVMLLAMRAFGCRFKALAAAGVYLFLPIGFWWSLGYQSENLENVFLVAALALLIGWTPRGAAAAGVMSALACHCNMTGVPYMLCNILFLAFRMPRLLLWYAPAALGTYAAIAGAAQWWTSGYFIDNVLLNQVGTFPRTDILQTSNPADTFLKYAARKIAAEGFKVIEIEGGLIMIASGGMILRLLAKGDCGCGPESCTRPDPTKPDPAWLRTEFLAWTFLGQLLSICFVAKGGTVNYIFVLAEPGIALFAGEGIVSLFRAALPARGDWRGLGIRNTRAFLMALAPVLLLSIAVLPSLANLQLTFDRVQLELPEDDVQEIRLMVGSYAEPGDMILAPPFYAFATGTTVAGELAENYIWNIKFMNETFDRQPADGVAKMDEIAALLAAGKPKIVLLDTAQTGQVPQIYAALAAHYQLAEKEPIRTRNTRLEVWIPNGESIRHIPLSR